MGNYNATLLGSNGEVLPSIILEESDKITLAVSSEDLASLSADEIQDFALGGVDIIDAVGNALALSFDQFKALDSIELTASDTVTLTVNGTNVSDLTNVQVADARAKGIDLFAMRDTGQFLGTLTVAQLSELAGKNINIIDASDNKLELSVDQYEALSAIKLSGSDTVSLFDTGAKIASLIAAQLSSFASNGIDFIDVNGNQLTLSMDQYNALGATKLTASDTITISDAGAKLAALTAAQISALSTAGVDILDANDNSYTLSSAQYNALGPVKLSGSDVVTIVADGDITLSHGGSYLTLTGSAVRGTGNSLANTISGNAASNVLEGLEGNDFLFGGLGNDQLSGGAGLDVFVFDKRTNKSTNVDRILDFKSKDDSIYLDDAIFTKLGRGSATGVKFKSDMFVENNKAKDREDRIVYDKKTGNLYYDQDGTGSKAQVKIATLSNKEKLFFHDFFVI